MPAKKLTDEQRLKVLTDKIATKTKRVELLKTINQSREALKKLRK